MKRLLAILVSVAMALGLVGALAEITPGAMELARRFVPLEAEHNSTGEDAHRLELTFKDAQANQYRVVLSKLPLYVIRVNMKAPNEAGASAVGLDEAGVRVRVLERFPGARIEQMFLEKKGEDEIFFHVILSLNGLLHKVRLNAQTGTITHYVLRGAPAPEQFQPVLLTQAQAVAAAVAMVPGGVATDVQFGRFSQIYYFMVEVHAEGSRHELMINAVDGSLLNHQEFAANMVAFRQAASVAKVPVSQDDDWLFEEDLQDDGPAPGQGDPFTDDSAIAQPVDDDDYDDDGIDDDDDDDDDNDGVADDDDGDDDNDGIGDDDDTDDDNDGVDDDADDDDDHDGLDNGVDDDDDNDGIDDDDDADDDNDGIDDDAEDDDDDSASTGTPAPTASPKPSVTPAPTASPKPTQTPAPTASADDDDDSSAATASPKPTSTPGPTASPKPTQTPAPTASPDDDDDSSSATASPKPTSTPGPTASPKPTSTPAPTASPKPTSTPAPTASPKPTSTPAPTAAAVPTEDPND